MILDFLSVCLTQSSWHGRDAKNFPPTKSSLLWPAAAARKCFVSSEKSDVKEAIACVEVRISFFQLLNGPEVDYLGGNYSLILRLVHEFQELAVE